MAKNLSSIFILVSGGLFAIAALGAAAGQADPDIVVILRGTGPGVAVPTGVPATQGCYETDLFDAKTNRRIGTGIDCLEIIGVDGVNFLVDRTTIFNFPEGRLVARGNTTVVPIFGASSPAFTHVVGDVDDMTDNVALGCATSGCTGRFRNATGDVRLSGIVDMTDLLNGIPSVGFNCIFVIDLN